MFEFEGPIAPYLEPVIVGLPTIIKSAITKSGRRLVEIEVSSEHKDIEGDVILQSALLNSAQTFLEKGHIDIDHYSELGSNPKYSFLGIRNPESYIIGYPEEVLDLGKGRTGIKFEVKQNNNGICDGNKYKYDMFWESLQTTPPTRWLASVYGFPGPDTETGTCAKGVCGDCCATRYLVKTFMWKSTAVTQNPINDTLKMAAKVVTMKSFAAMLKSNIPMNNGMSNLSRTMIKSRFIDHICKSCPSTHDGKNINIWTVRDHYIKCENLDYNQADIYALATDSLFR